MKTFSKIFVCALAAALLGGCGEEELKTMVSFHLGTAAGGMPTTAVREIIEMPQSGFRLMCNTDIFMYNGDLERVDVAQVSTPDGAKINGFYFKSKVDGARKLLAVTAANLNNFIVVKINGKPIGLRKIDTVIPDGMLFVIADTKDDLHKTAAEINDAIAVAEKIKEGL
ncbi:MAG: hypothetical protein IJI37_01670 [Opitutales bacterium]|nr:hypothetical protein [Opitutales bacterium]